MSLAFGENAAGMPGCPQLNRRLKNVRKIPTQRMIDAAYISGSPGSFITLKIEIDSPMKPDWYTFQGWRANGVFMWTRNGNGSFPGVFTVTSDS